MTISIDTNVLTALWNADDAANTVAKEALNKAESMGRLIITGIVYAELLAGPGQTEEGLDHFFNKTGIPIEWQIEEDMLRVAGQAYQSYAARRRKSHSPMPRRILADFLIGAHAEVRGYSLLTLDKRLYRTSYPGLKLFPAAH